MHATHPRAHAAAHPNKIAYRMAGSGEAITYGELERRANQGAHLLRSLGLKAGDHIAFIMENSIAFMELCWAAQRTGIYHTAISRYLTPDEIAYIVRDCGAKALIVTPQTAEQAAPLAGQPGLSLFMARGVRPGFRDFDAERAAMPDTPIADEVTGYDMLYSSGTTGRPKGVKKPFMAEPIEKLPPLMKVLCQDMCGMGEDTVYLSPAPLYHAAPLRFNMIVAALGGTSVIMEKFDAEEFLRLVDAHRVTHAQLVPTMFVRMLKLPDEVRARYDVSSIRAAVHAAAPCPADVKQAMIDWWGPILLEYYAGTEGNGVTVINSTEWLSHRGSVGRSFVDRSRSSARTGGAAGWRDRRGLFRRRPGLRLSQRRRQDRRRPQCPGLVDARRHRLPRRRGLSLPHRPQGLHDHLRRGEHLPAGDGGRADPPSGRRRRRRLRHPQCRDGRGGEGRRPAARHGRGRP